MPPTLCNASLVVPTMGLRAGAGRALSVEGVRRQHNITGLFPGAQAIPYHCDGDTCGFVVETLGRHNGVTENTSIHRTELACRGRRAQMEGTPAVATREIRAATTKAAAVVVAELARAAAVALQRGHRGHDDGLASGVRNGTTT